MLRCITNNCFESLNNLILRKIFSGTKKSKRKRKLTPAEPETDVGFLWQDEEFKKLKIRKYKADLEEQELRMNLIHEQTNLFVEQSEESRKRQILLDLQANLLRHRIANYEMKLIIEERGNENMTDD